MKIESYYIKQENSIKILCISMFMFLSFLYVTGTSQELGKNPNTQKINNYLSSLKNWPDAKGKDSTVTKYILRPDKWNNKVMYKCTYTEKNLVQDSELIKWEGATKQKLWPGAIYSSESILNGSPSIVRVQRSPIKLSINAPLEKPTITIDNPTMANVSDEINTNFLLKIKPNERMSKIKSNTTQTNSYEETLFAMGASAKFPIEGVKIGAEAAYKDKETKKTTTISGYFEQTLFTITLDDDEIATNADFFGNDANLKDLKNALDNDEFSPVFVSEVNYGRRIVFLMTSESEESASEMEAAINASVPDAEGKIKLTDEQKKILSTSHVSAYAIGPFKSEQYEDFIKQGEISKLFEDVEPKTSFPIAFKVNYLNNPNRKSAILVNKILTDPTNLDDFCVPPTGHKITITLKSLYPNEGGCRIPHSYYGAGYVYKDWSLISTSHTAIINNSLTLSEKKIYPINASQTFTFYEPENMTKPHFLGLYSGYWTDGFLPSIDLFTGGHPESEGFTYPFNKLNYGKNERKYSTSKLLCPCEWTYEIAKEAIYPSP